MIGMDKNLDELIQVLISIKTKEKMYDFLLGLLTPKELIELPNRLKIVKMLKKGLSHQEIAQQLKVGVATVTRGSREINLGRFKYI